LNRSIVHRGFRRDDRAGRLAYAKLVFANLSNP
jgi:hypothetical protein